MSCFSAAFGRLFRDNGLEDYLECSEKFEFLYGKLVEANSRVNITAITDRDEVIVKHFADCVRAAGYIPQNADVVDIGWRGLSDAAACDSPPRYKGVRGRFRCEKTCFRGRRFP